MSAPSASPTPVNERSSRQMQTPLPPPPSAKPSKQTTVPASTDVHTSKHALTAPKVHAVSTPPRPPQGTDQPPSAQGLPPATQNSLLGALPASQKQPVRRLQPVPVLLNPTPLPPPPISPFSKSRPTVLPKLSLGPSSKNKFALTAKQKSSKNSRTAFLTAALSPSFVSAKPLHTRTHTTISEIVGNLAPERYLSLPARSPPAAKALLATSVCKELRDVHKLEAIRTRHGDVEGGGWFDYVLDSLGKGTKLEPFTEKMKTLVIPPWHGMTDRVAFLPLESLNICSVMGQDFSEMVRKKGDNLRICKTRPIESAETRIGRMKSSIKAQVTRKNTHQPEKRAVANVQTKPSPLDDSLDDDLRPPLPMGRTPSASQTQNTTGPSTAATSPPPKAQSNDIVMIDIDTPAQSSTDIPAPKPRVQLPVSLVFDDATGKVSIDWEIREIPPKIGAPVKPAVVTPAPTVKPSATNLPASNKRNAVAKQGAPAPEQTTMPKSRPNPIVQVPTPSNVVPVAHRMRIGGLVSNLDTLLHEIDEDIVAAQQQDKAQGSDPEVVVVEEAKETPAPKPAQRRTKRKRVERTQERAVETEQRASRMRSAVVSALQEDHEARRQRAARSSIANGHAKPKKKVSFSGRRMSRRSKKNPAPILDSSGSEKEYRRDEDDDFTIDAEDVIEVLPVPKANGTRASAPDLSPPMSRPPPPPLGRDPSGGMTEEIESLDGSDMVSPPIRAVDLRTTKQVAKKASRSGASKQARMHKFASSSSRRERHRQIDEETHEGQPELWNREILRVQRLIEENEQDSDPLLNEIEYNPYRFYEQVPILRRVIKAAKAQHGHLMDMDKVDEYEEMDQFYKETRNDPAFGSGSRCPGTEFLEHIFEQTERERFNAMTGYDGDPSNSALDALQDDRLDVPVPSKRAVGVVNLTSEEGQPLSPGHESSESSAESSGEDDEMCQGGSKRSRSQARSRASKARELQSRVCGDLLGTMTNEAKRRVLRWAERDFSWFDRGVDVMEIVASRAYKRCSRCDSGGGTEENCEESILLKLWKDMSWRKVRRMRHRSGTT